MCHIFGNVQRKSFGRCRRTRVPAASYDGGLDGVLEAEPGVNALGQIYAGFMIFKALVDGGESCADSF